MGEIRSDIGVAAEQVLSQGRVDAFLQGVSEPGSLVRELRRLRAENAALKAILERAVASSHNCWEAEARALLSPQAAEPRPRIVCLCGSTRFMDAFHEAGWRETLLGNIVLSVGVCKYAETPDGGHVAESLGPEVVKALDELHKRKIDLADEVLILNVGGYVGESTQSEIDYARAHGKPIRWLEDPQAAELPCPTIEQVEGAYGEAMYEQERETR